MSPKRFAKKKTVSTELLVKASLCRTGASASASTIFLSFLANRPMIRCIFNVSGLIRRKTLNKKYIYNCITLKVSLKKRTPSFRARKIFLMIWCHVSPSRPMKRGYVSKLLCVELKRNRQTNY